MSRFPIRAIALLIVATPAFAQQPATDASPAPPARPDKICRTVPITGRRISETKCYTAAQWAEYDRVNKEAADKMVNDVSAQGNIAGSFTTGTMFGLGPHP